MGVTEEVVCSLGAGGGDGRFSGLRSRPSIVTSSLIEGKKSRRSAKDADNEALDWDLIVVAS